MSTHLLPLARRTFLSHTTTLTASVALRGAPWAMRPTMAMPESQVPDPRPQDALTTLCAALRRYPLVALGEAHRLQEEHDLIAALLRHPALPPTLTDIVVEFGNARYQEVADRFILGDAPVANADLRSIWRDTTITGGNPVWDAPVYEQFFRAVRAVNWMRPPTRRIRVLLGDPPIDWAKVRTSADMHRAIPYFLQRDAHYATVVEREVLRKGRRALLIAGTGHVLRGLHADTVPGTPAPLNAGTLLSRSQPHALFVIDLLSDAVSTAILTFGLPLIAAGGSAFVYGRDADPALELALATPTSPRLVLLARIALVGCIDLALSLATATLVAGVHGHGLGPPVTLWLGPLALLSSASLLLSLLIGPAATVSACVAGWGAQFVQVGATLTVQAPVGTVWQSTPLMIAIATLLVLFAVLYVPREERLA